MATFVLRLAGTGGSDLHGTARHVTTGVTRTFTDSTQLLAFLEEWTATDGLGVEPGKYREEDSSCGQ